MTEEQIADEFRRAAAASAMHPIGRGWLQAVERFVAEIRRLKRGDFTPEEFQALCHHRDESPDCTRADFEAGCAAYQRKLFGPRAPGESEPVREKEVLNPVELAHASHTPGPAAVERMNCLRRAFIELHNLILASSLPSREQSIAVTHLQESAMWANRAAVLADPLSAPQPIPPPA